MPMAVQQLLLSFLATIGVYVLYKLGRFIYQLCTSPLNVLPGPPNPSYIFGNMKLIWAAESSALHEKWAEEYGPTLTYNVFFGMKRLYTQDPKAINHILVNNYIYQKPSTTRYHLSQILGDGVLVVEGDKHKQQRKIMNPAFGAGQIREMTEIFMEKSIKLRDMWAAKCNKEGDNVAIDVLSWLSKMTLDVIGLAGFNYEFNALSDGKSELNEAFSTIFHSGMKVSLIPIIKAAVPALRSILTSKRDTDTSRARESMKHIGNQLLTDSKAAVLHNKASWTRRDLLSLLVRANTSTDLPQTQRMSDEDVIAQVPTFLAAGHETTSTATTWALFALSHETAIQKKLREELLKVGSDNPTMDELNALPYLDAVVRETLRIHAPVPGTTRVAAQDDIIPLATPVKDRDGKMLDSIRIVKGQTIFVPLLAMNRMKSVWGEDSHEFRPERWEDIPKAAGTIPGVWGNMMSFLGGPRACIGYRFSLVEMKALLFTLVRAFEFELTVPKDDIGRKGFVVQRPMLKSDPDGGNQLPLRLKPVRSQL